MTHKIDARVTPAPLPQVQVPTALTTTTFANTERPSAIADFFDRNGPALAVVGTSTTTGTLIGAAVAGPIGAAIGAAIGFSSGIMSPLILTGALLLTMSIVHKSSHNVPRE